METVKRICIDFNQREYTALTEMAEAKQVEPGTMLLVIIHGTLASYGYLDIDANREEYLRDGHSNGH